VKAVRRMTVALVCALLMGIMVLPFGATAAAKKIVVGWAPPDITGVFKTATFRGKYSPPRSN
jgi:ABC-type sugar transport system substrate-binding protein